MSHSKSDYFTQPREIKKKSFVRNFDENLKFWFDLGSTITGRDPRTEFMLGKTINQSII